MAVTPLRIGNYPFWGPESDICSATTFEPTPKCKPGYGPETISFLCEYLHIPYEIINLPENIPIGGLQSDGTWSGMLGLIENGTIDVISVPWIETEIRQQYFSFTVPTHIFPSSYVVGTVPPSTIEIASRIFATFEWTLLITIFATIFTLFAILVGTHYLWDKNTYLHANTSNDIDSHKLVHAATVKHTKQPKFGMKVLVLMYAIVVVLFADLYKDSLLVFILVPQKDVKMSEDMIWRMVMSKRLKLVAVRDQYSNSGTWQNVHDAKSSKFKFFQQALEANPPLLVETMDEVIAIFDTNPPDLVYFTDLCRAVHMIRDNTKLSLVDVEEPDLNVYGYMFRKNSSLIAQFDEVIKRSVAFIYNRQNYYITPRKNAAVQQGSKTNREVVSSLSIIQLLGAFVILTIGIIISACSFVAEKMMENISKKKQYDIALKSENERSSSLGSHSFLSFSPTEHENNEGSFPESSEFEFTTNRVTATVNNGNFPPLSIESIELKENRKRLERGYLKSMLSSNMSIKL